MQLKEKALRGEVAPGAKVDKWPSLLYIPPMPEVRLIPNRSRTLPFTGPLPTREHRKIALSVEGEAAALTAAAPKGMKVDMGNIPLTEVQKALFEGPGLTESEQGFLAAAMVNFKNLMRSGTTEPRSGDEVLSLEALR